MAVEVRHTRPADIDALAPVMRRADTDEVWASHGMTPGQAIAHSVEQSDRAWTAFIGGDIACMFGVAGPACVLDDTGRPWLLGARTLPRHAVTFFRHSRVWFERMKPGYGGFEGWVDSRNVMSKRWLGWLGFEIKDPVPVGHMGLVFHPFEMRF